MILFCFSNQAGSVYEDNYFCLGLFERLSFVLDLEFGFGSQGTTIPFREFLYIY